MVFPEGIQWRCRFSSIFHAGVPWVAAQIAPYFVLALDRGAAKAFGLGLASTIVVRNADA